ncbi:MAG: hypothetical protein K9M84_05705 [Spirochaetia bacterium]|nr:hypothetical protein [Spirochaetia bacterium]MCF7941083.1 hypothetical protein [Spirochaetia bacterium]
MKRTIQLIVISFCIGSAALLSASPISRYIPQLDEGQLDRLKAGELLSNDSQKSDSLKLLGQETLIAEAVEQVPLEADTLFVECLTLIPYPEYMGSLDEEELLLKIFNTLRSVSTQEGITYISHRKGNKPATLISSSHVTNRVGSRTVLPDVVVQQLPEEDTLIVFQDDTSFRKNFYEYHYRTRGDEIYVEMTNKTDMKVFGLIPAVKRDVLQITLSLIAADEGIIAYSVAVAPHQRPVIDILVFSVHLPSAFQRRLVAVQEWFTARLQE